ncbi:MAG: radical SAM protein [Thermomicrobiales bacterium]
MANGIDTYIFKLASFCNLNCSYCYYFNAADRSFMGRPKLMSMEVVNLTVDKIIEHAQANAITAVDLTLHGGEPLLYKKSGFKDVMKAFDRIDAAGIVTRRKCQTNAVLIDREWAELMAEWGIYLGISMDGPQAVHDQFRVDHAGRGSYTQTRRGLALALEQEAAGLHTSVLSVVDPRQSGRDAYRHLRSLGVKRMDFLIPESNYAYPPDHYEPLGESTPYGDFLNEVFDAWIEEDDPSTNVRLLDRMVRSFLGQGFKSDVVGGAPVNVAVIETDGSIEPTDNFKACADGMTDLGLSVYSNSFDDLYADPFFRLCIASSSQVPEMCHSCRHFDRCGGGRISTRYSREEGFARRTIYCNDLLASFDHIGAAVRALGETETAAD